jgi:23S rRNA pseudouridine2605 synthase
MSEERLQKIIASSGLCSRRQGDELIRAGRVTLNGEIAKLGDKADPTRDHVKVDGKRVGGAEPLRHLLVYKPREVVTTCEDPEGRTTVLDLVRSVVSERVFPVGRLDYHSEGLIILTNDGQLAMVNHPRFGLVREYMVKVRGELSDEEQQRLLHGTTIEGHRVRPLSVSREAGTRGGGTWWRVEVSEGRTHEIRELFFRVGHHVQRLKRTAIGPIRDTTLRPGELRLLTAPEVRALRQLVVRKSGRRPPRRAPTPSAAAPARRRTQSDPRPRSRREGGGASR